MTIDKFKADFPTETVAEGKVRILVPKLKAFVRSPSDYAPSKAPVFYNPVMEFNRDLSVLALQAYQKMIDHEISVCEPLTGCGIRGIRYATEVKGVKKVVISDISQKAVKLAKYNAQNSRFDDRVEVKDKEANFLLSAYGAPHRRFDVIDIDPFGSPVPYIDSAIRALCNNGLLASTATDLAPLCGVHSKACIRKYGGKPLRTEYCHEQAIRLLAGCIATTAAKYDTGINVMFSHSTDHYIRVYANIKYGAKNADESIRKMGYMLHCYKCFHREPLKGVFTDTQSLSCSECGGKMATAGPLWLGKIFETQFCESMMDEAKHFTFRNAEKIRKSLALIRNEVDAPISYYVVDKLCDALALPVPSVKSVVDALRKEGYQACLTHFNSNGIRSDVPAIRIQKILRVMASYR